MINRVTENMKFNTITSNLFNVQAQSAQLMEKLAAQKMINRPSDNPIGASNVLNYRSTLAAMDQYQTNITDAKTWLTLTDTNLTSIKDLVAQARGIAISQSSAVASSETMDSSASVVASLIKDISSLMNARHGDSYLFGGSKTDVLPFAETSAPAAVGLTFAATANSFNGAAVSGGVFTGEENKTYALKIIDAGTPPTLANASYSISSDGGRTWGATQTDLSAPIALGDGITMTFTAGTKPMAAGDLFSVTGYAGGYYRGNDDQLTIQISKSNNFAYNITGSSAFTAANGPVAQASVAGAGAGLIANDTISLTRGAAAGSWTLTSHALYPNMKITSASAAAVTIDADNDGTDDIMMDLSGNWSAGNVASFSVAAGPPPSVGPVSVSGAGTVDLLAAMQELKTALEQHDVNKIFAQIDKLIIAEKKILERQTEAGSKISSLDLAGSNHKAFSEQVTSLKSEIEDADLAKLIMSIQMKQIAMQASYNLSAQIGKMTILDYL